MLLEIGFTYAHRIDPFDGGPHFHARTDNITLVRDTRAARVAVAEPAAPDAQQTFLVARERPAPSVFRAVRVTGAVAAGEGGAAVLALPQAACDVLEVAPGDEIAYLPLA